MTLWRIFTRRAQDITASYANPKGREILPAHPLCIRRRYVGCRHTTTGAADHTSNRSSGAELSGITARAEGELQALDGGAVFFGGTMKRAVVKRRRMRSGHTWLRSGSQGRVHAAGALSSTSALARRGACAFVVYCKWRDGR